MLNEFETIIRRSDMISCLMCHDAPCSKACPFAVDPAKRLRSIWFENEKGAAAGFPEPFPCTWCLFPCESSCVKPGQVPIKELMTRLYGEVAPGMELKEISDEDRLKTDICGIPLENPFLLSSSVVASTYDMCARAFEAGWAGAAFKTICNFEIHEASPRFSAITGSDGSIIGFKNIETHLIFRASSVMISVQEYSIFFPKMLVSLVQ